jgi:hypothetical protein
MIDWTAVYKTSVAVKENRFWGEATPQQLTRLNIGFSALTHDRSKRLEIISQTVGRPITSTKDLTKVEASVLIELTMNIRYMADMRSKLQ